MINRKQFGILIALALGAGFVGGVVGSFSFSGEIVFAEKSNPIQKLIQAERIEIVDSKGESKIQLYTLKNGSPVLKVSDGSKGSVEIVSNPDFPSAIYLTDDNELGNGIVIGVNKNGNQALDFTRNGKERFKVIVKSETTAVSLLDKDENLRSFWGETSDRGPFLYFYDVNGESFNLERSGLKFHDRDNKTKFFLGLHSESKEPTILLWDRYDKGRVS